MVATRFLRLTEQDRFEILEALEAKFTNATVRSATWLLDKLVHLGDFVWRGDWSRPFTFAELPRLIRSGFRPETLRKFLAALRLAGIVETDRGTHSIRVRIPTLARRSAEGGSVGAPESSPVDEPKVSNAKVSSVVGAPHDPTPASSTRTPANSSAATVTVEAPRSSPVDPTGSTERSEWSVGAPHDPTPVPATRAPASSSAAGAKVSNVVGAPQSSPVDPARVARAVAWRKREKEEAIKAGKGAAPGNWAGWLAATKTALASNPAEVDEILKRADATAAQEARARAAQEARQGEGEALKAKLEREAAAEAAWLEGLGAEGRAKLEAEVKRLDPSTYGVFERSPGFAFARERVEKLRREVAKRWRLGGGPPTTPTSTT